jgi:hypothetical protein
MIQMSVAQVVTSEKPIANILAAKLPVKAAYQLAKIGKTLGKELETFNEQRNKLITELGRVNGSGVPEIKAEDENFPEFVRQMNDLLSMQIKIDLDPVKLDALGDKAEIAPSDLIACDGFIIE